MNKTGNINISTSLKTNTTALAETNTDLSMFFIGIYIAPCPTVLCTHYLADFAKERS